MAVLVTAIHALRTAKTLIMWNGDAARKPPVPRARRGWPGHAPAMTISEWSGSKVRPPGFAPVRRAATRPAMSASASCAERPRPFTPGIPPRTDCGSSAVRRSHARPACPPTAASSGKFHCDLHFLHRSLVASSRDNEDVRQAMAGKPVATLEGWAVAMPGTSWDHTYVTSSCGLRWGCWGRSAGGSAICHGTGSSIIADCLSQTNSEAGITYALTGVCHQTANRILHPAGGITVAGCRGYATSTFLFGVYGSGAWPQLVSCYPPGPPSAVIGSPRTLRGGSMTSKHDYDRAVAAAHGTAAEEEAIRTAELAALIEFCLGEPLDRPTFDALARIQAKLREAQRGLAAEYELGVLGPEEYLPRINAGPDPLHGFEPGGSGGPSVRGDFRGGGAKSRQSDRRGNLPGPAAFDVGALIY